MRTQTQQVSWIWNLNIMHIFIYFIDALLALLITLKCITHWEKPFYSIILICYEQIRPNIHYNMVQTQYELPPLPKLAENKDSTKYLLEHTIAHIYHTYCVSHQKWIWLLLSVKSQSTLINVNIFDEDHIILLISYLFI